METRLIEKVLEGVPHGQRRRVVEEIAESMEVHYSTIYRKLARKNGPTKTTPRDCEIAQEYIDMVAQIKGEGMRFGDKERELSTERCIYLLEEAGKVPKGLLLPSTVNRRLMMAGFRQRKAAVRYEAEFANQAQQLDFSRAEYFELMDFDSRAGDFICMVNARGLSYKNKEGKKQRLWLCQIKDEYSRIRLVRYFAATNENSLMGLQMLNFAWRREPDDHPLHYVPHYMRTDNGSFAKSEYAQSMMERLDMKWLPSKVGNKRSLGKVERGWRDLWQWELQEALRLGDKATIYLKDLNLLVSREMLRELEMEHPTRKGKRGDLYRRSLASAEQAQRKLEVSVIDLATKVLERVVGDDCMVKIEGNIYKAPDAYAGRWIRIIRHPQGAYIGESWDRRDRFELAPFEFRSFLDYQGVPDTYQEQMAKEYRQELVEGQGQEQGQGQGQGWGQGQEQGRGQGGNVVYMPAAREERIAVESPFALPQSGQFGDVEEAMRYIGKRLGLPYSKVAHLFDELIRVCLDKQTIEDIIQELKNAI